ncbi:hypothetical protein [Pseudomonas alabamensis]|uniref:hypothetical protein n=1 Tax=Pseudomonas alabamensis TaxID=3064349 RepID=UPI0011A77462
MKKLAFAFMLIALAGCENSKEKEAQQLVDQARGLWDQVMPAAPEISKGKVTTSKEGLVAAVDKLGEARQLLDNVRTNYSETDVWKSEKTQVLDDRVTNLYRSTKEAKYKMGW